MASRGTLPDPLTRARNSITDSAVLARWAISWRETIADINQKCNHREYEYEVDERHEIFRRMVSTHSRHVSTADPTKPTRVSVSPTRLARIRLPAVSLAVVDHQQ